MLHQGLELQINRTILNLTTTNRNTKNRSQTSNIRLKWQHYKLHSHTLLTMKDLGCIFSNKVSSLHIHKKW